MQEYDYIIVGAGSAGCVLANRITADPSLKVLVLEAGGRDLHPYVHMPLTWRTIWQGPLYNWMYKTEPEPYLDGRKVSLPRGKVLGGSSTINGLLYIRGNPRDYDTWRQMGNYGWSYDQVLPYFKRSENNWRGETKVHGAGGPLQVTPVDVTHYSYEPMMQAAVNAGIPLTHDFAADPEGFNRLDVTVGNGRRSSAARAYLYPAMKRENLFVMINALSHRVIVENGRAAGVEYAHQGHIFKAWARREVILSGGSYNSPQLLMLSGIGDPDEIAQHGIRPVHELRGVGKNLSEHPIVPMQFEANTTDTFVQQLRFDRLAVQAVRYAVTRGGPFGNQVITANAFVRTRPELDTPNMQLFFAPVSFTTKVWFPGIRPAEKVGLGGSVCLLRPESRGHVTLRSANPNDPPKVTLNFMKERVDREATRDGLRMLRKVYNTKPLSDMISSEVMPGIDVESDDAFDAYIRKTADVCHHPVGTCSMGANGQSVVDPELRVHGIEGLRVVDASVMPLVPSGNTNAPTIMIAEKASDMILGKAPLPAAEL
jgi:choline dehydrogenase